MKTWGQFYDVQLRKTVPIPSPMVTSSKSQTVTPLCFLYFLSHVIN
jgi:hypothetical protein